MAKIGSKLRSAIIHDFLEVLGKTGNTAAKFQNHNDTSDYQHIMDSMIKTFNSNVPMADMAPGSVINTLLQAVAQQQAQLQQDTKDDK